MTTNKTENPSIITENNLFKLFDITEDGSSDDKKFLKNIVLPAIKLFLLKHFNTKKFDETKNSYDSPHDDITLKVYRRLLLRHSIINTVENLASLHGASTDSDNIYKNGVLNLEALESFLAEKQMQDQENRQASPSSIHNDIKHSLLKYKKKSSENTQPFFILPSQQRAYNLAVTDIFVEKALTYLNRKAKKYDRMGFISAITSFSFLAFGAVISLIKFIFNDGVPKEVDYTWYFITSFTKAFTFYGFIVIISVFLYRMTKAFFDQSERIKDRRHALRQGRLFVHLNGGKLTIDELERAFNWNVTQDNAFAKINPEAQAPWGSVAKDILRTVRETAKSGALAVEDIKRGKTKLVL